MPAFTNPGLGLRKTRLDAVLILLPPSEGKQPAGNGAPFDAAELQFPELNPHRHQLLAALAEVSRADDALEVLGVGKSLVAEVTRNIELHTEPAAAAHTVYTGVLFEALGYERLDAAARARADASILVISALWGAVGFADRIPAYRLSMSVKLPGDREARQLVEAEAHPGA